MPTAQQVGRSGELFVAAEISRRGAIASLFLTNTPRVDIIASNNDQTRLINIQVKTKGPRSSVWQWSVRKLREELRKEPGDQIDFIVFVGLNNLSEPPVYYVCPLREFVEAKDIRHSDWELRYTEKHGKKVDSDHLSVDKKDLKDEWKDNWSLLGIFNATAE